MIGYVWHWFKLHTLSLGAQLAVGRSVPVTTYFMFSTFYGE